MELPQGVPPDPLEPPADAADRRRAAEHVHESLAVEAGAGTGKTTLLVARIVNLLRGARPDQPPARMSEIVAITFTEKAAGELKARLRTVLEVAVVTGRFGDEPLPDHERTRLRDALEDLDRAVVSTIHSFCAALIRERPVEAGIDPGRTTADATTQSLLLDEAWERWRERAFDDAHDDVLAATLRSDLKADRTSPLDRSPSLRDLAATLVANRDLLKHLPAVIDEDDEWDKWKPILDEHVTAMTECLRYLRKHTDNDDGDKPTRLTCEFTKLWSTLRTKSAAEARTKLWTEPKGLDEYRGEFRGEKRKWRDLTKLAELNRLLNDLRKRLLPDLRAMLSHNLTVSLSHRLENFVASFQQLKVERGLLDFQDMLIIARDMLVRSEETREYFRRRFRHLLIDEFQDTDPLQAEVAMLLSQESEVRGQRSEVRSQKSEIRDQQLGAEPAHRSPTTDHHSPLTTHHSLFLVGDPKQSIYRFRRADIEFYDQCTRQLGDAQRLRIRQNFRSGSRIIHWVNRVFEPLIAVPADGHYQPEYVPLIPGPHADESPGRVVLLCPPEPRNDLAGNIEDVRYREGCCIAQFIQRVKDKWETSRESSLLGLADVAILLPATTGIEQYEAAFRAIGLPYHIIGGKHFYQRVEIKSLTSVVTAIDNPEDAIALVGALRCQFFGCSDEDLLRHSLDGGRFNYLRPRTKPAEPLAGIFDLLIRLHRNRNARPVARTLMDIFDATKGLEGFLTKPDGESRVANLLKVVDSARSLERSGVLTFRGFARWLRERESAREEESESPQAEPGDASVQVLTVHKSKGLEFPMTIVANLNSGSARPADQIIFDRVTNKLHLKCGPLSTTGWREAQEWDKCRAEAERKRLFYVAATRARDYLVLPVFWQKPNEQPAGLHQYLDDANLLPPPGELDWGKLHNDMLVFDTRTLPPWPEPQHAPRIDLDKLAGDAAAEQFLYERTDWAREHAALVAAARIATPVVHASQLASPTLSDPTTHLLTYSPLAPAGGAEFGSLAHRLIELHFTCSLSPDALVTAAEHLAAAAGLDAAAGRAAAELVFASLDAPLFARLRAARRVFFEVPFTFADGDRIIEGRIDAVAEEADGLLIVDFKTDRVAPGAERAVAEQYAPQLQTYSHAVATATARPVREAVVFFLRTREPVAMDISRPAITSSDSPTASE